ncbi:MAG TPA: radical SAM protein [Phycisphaerales bacterium]|nr:radical SAM protein [Phycisphaerales bacterium]HRQ76520.1 radical SAM protein [Phycisphaerales bacterium]
MQDTLRINEVFFSIQGESTWAGCPCVFIRLTGCHLRCTYCDTEYAFKEGATRSIDDILAEVCSHPCNLVEITGGEPLLQKRVHTLITRLCDLGKTVLIETSGACDISVCDPRAIRILDLKTPGSGEAERNLWTNLDCLTPCDEVKFVITSREDYDWAKNVIETHNLGARCGAVLMSAVFEQPPGLEIAGCPSLNPRSLAEWMLHDPPKRGGPIRMQTQLHKIIWEPQTRGV